MIFSIIFPTISTNDLFFNSLDAIINQKFNLKYEIIIINDNPNLNLSPIIEKRFSNHSRYKFIKILQNKKNLGLTASLIKAIKCAKGKYIIRNDEDDISDVHRLNEIFNIYKTKKGIKFISSNYIYNFNYLKIYKKLSTNIKNLLVIKNPFAHSSITFEKKYYNEVGGYNKTLFVSQDYDLWSRFLIKDSNCHYNINKYLITINRTKNNITNKYSKEQRINSVLIALRFKFNKLIFYNNFKNPMEKIHNVLNFKSDELINLKSYSNALCYCYLYDMKVKCTFNATVILLILKIYLSSPLLLIRKIIN